MNGNTYIDDALDAKLERRLMHLFISVSASFVFLTGMLTGPLWIFSLSVLSIGLAMSAIAGAGGFDELLGRGRSAEVVAIPHSGAAPAAQRDIKRAA